MPRGALPLAALFFALTPSNRVFAHGVPPDAYAVLSHDVDGPRAVSLSAGIALRRSPERYQFVCPQAWSDQFSSPVAALADGTLVIGATSGLMLLGQDGSLRAHPDPAAVGRSSDVVHSARGLFSLRSTAEGSEVLAIDAQQVRVLWKDAKNFSSLAALDDKLVVLRANATMLEQVTIAIAGGAELERQVAMLALPVDNVFARANAGTAYVLAVFRSGRLALGSLRMNAFTEVATADLSIAGPLDVDGLTLLALDGKLTQLVGDRTAPLADDQKVVGLGEQDGLRYACESSGITRMRGQALGEPLFRFGWLVAPDLAQITDDDARFLCNSQWQDLRFDVQLAGTTLDGDAMPIAGGAPAGGTGAAVSGGQSLPTAGAGAAGGGGAAMVPGPQASKASAGCAAAPLRSPPPPAAGVYALGLVLALVLVRSRRRSARGD